LKAHGIGDGQHALHVGRRGQSVFPVLPALGWGGFPVPGQIEGNDAKMPGERRIVHERAELPPVRSRRVQANERNAGAGFLHVEPMLLAVELKAQVAPDGALEVGTWASSHCPSGLARGKANSSLKYLRLAMKGY